MNLTVRDGIISLGKLNSKHDRGVGKLGRSKVGLGILGKLGFGKVGRLGGKLGRSTTSKSASVKVDILIMFQL